jgi:hypothetical protein
MCFFNSVEFVYLEQTEPTYILKNLSTRSISFQKQIKFSQENNVLDDPASNTVGFLSRDTCVSSAQLKKPIWNKQSLSPP